MGLPIRADAMGYYMRYISTDSQDITLPWLQEAMRRIDPRYSIEDQETGRRETGFLHFAGELYGQFEINRAGDGLFEQEIEEFMGGAEAGEEEGHKIVLEVLNAARCIVALQVFWQDRGTEATLERISPLWSLLFDTRSGLLQADAEGFYRGTELILPSG